MLISLVLAVIQLFVRRCFAIAHFLRTNFRTYNFQQLNSFSLAISFPIAALRVPLCAAALSHPLFTPLMSYDKRFFFPSVFLFNHKACLNNNIHPNTLTCSKFARNWVVAGSRRDAAIRSLPRSSLFTLTPLTLSASQVGAQRLQQND